MFSHHQLKVVFCHHSFGIQVSGFLGYQKLASYSVPSFRHRLTACRKPGSAERHSGFLFIGKLHKVASLL
jgi:hypothetical protein